MKTILFPLLAFSLALSGMLYELSFAQVLSAVLGGTLLQYSITIGLFTFALGTAALVQERIARSMRALFFLQLATAATAVIGHLWLEKLFDTPSTPFLWLAYSPAFLIGFLTGLELPLLLDKTAPGPKRSSLIAWDYLGMFAATLLFPLYLLPNLGSRGATAAAVILNVSSALLLLASRSEVNRWQAP